MFKYRRLLKQQSAEYYRKLKILYKKLYIEFLAESSLTGLKVFLQIRSPIQHAKLLWGIIIISFLAITSTVIANLIARFIAQPMERYISPSYTHVANTDFPAIGVCSPNKMSKRKLIAYSEKVYKAQQIYQPDLLAKNVSEMSKHVLGLTGFYIYPYNDFNVADNRLLHLHDILTFMYNTSNYPTRSIMRDLAPDCEDLVVRAFIFGNSVDPKGIFTKSMTSSSVCCIFNYNRRSFSINPTNVDVDGNAVGGASTFTMESSTVLNSLQIVVESDLEDFTFSEMFNDAFQVFIFQRDDFPMPQSNVRGQIFVDHGSIVEVPIEQDFFNAKSAIRFIPPRSRNCYFPDEGRKALNKSYYSHDECLLHCRLDSLIKYCGCVNPPAATVLRNATICSFLDLPCLTQWKRIFNRWNYFDYVNDASQTKSSSYGDCGHCLPACNAVELLFHVNVNPIAKEAGEYYTNGLLEGLGTAKTLAIIKLYYRFLTVKATDLDVSGNWVVLLNRFGGICSLFFGFSIISFIELFYFATCKWFTKKINTSHELNTVLINDQPPAYELYWQELVPKSNSIKKYRGAKTLKAYTKH